MRLSDSTTHRRIRIIAPEPSLKWAQKDPFQYYLQVKSSEDATVRIFYFRHVSVSSLCLVILSLLRGGVVDATPLFLNFTIEVNGLLSCPVHPPSSIIFPTQN